jgi:hypothetical protein
LILVKEEALAVAGSGGTTETTAGKIIWPFMSLLSLDS